jgi:predicted RNA binding protein YcfA (HicA-like mRNA interferase family)
MPKSPVLTPVEIIKLLQTHGFVIDRIKGSHHILINQATGKRVVVPMHKKNLPKGTLHEIIKQSGISLD